MAMYRTSLMLDPELVEQAAEALGTKSKSETVRAALEATVRMRSIQSLAAWRLTDDEADEIEAARAWRDPNSEP